MPRPAASSQTKGAAKRVVVYDTTLRDGAQGPAVSFSAADKVRIARALDGLGFDYVEGGFRLQSAHPGQRRWYCRNNEGSHRVRAGTAALDDGGLLEQPLCGAPHPARSPSSKRRWRLSSTRSSTPSSRRLAEKLDP
jgi:hypothetical protein